MTRILFLVMFSLVLSGCDNPDWTWPWPFSQVPVNQQPASQAVGLEKYAAKPEPVPAAATAVPPQAVSVDPPLTANDIVAPAAQPAKTYTFQGNVLLPPDAYLINNGGQNINDTTDICGVLSIDQPNAQKYCYKLSQFYNHLYDAEHTALDVWDVQGNWYLLLVKSTNGLASDMVTPQQELWVDKSQFGVYHPYADIMKQRLLFLGDWDYASSPTWPLQAYSAPDGPPVELKAEQYPATKSSSPMVMITAVAQSSKKELWFKLNLVNSLCETAQTALPAVPVVSNIWFPAYRTQNNLRVPNVWYYAKGC